VLLVGGIAVTYTLYIARVGGDFMYARMLIPATPFYALLVELAMEGFDRSLSRWSLGLITVFGLWTGVRTPGPVPAKGVGNEWAFYYGARERKLDRLGKTLRGYFAGLPVRILVFGAQARVAYRSEAAYVLEGDGLTDPIIAHQPLATRGRPGHEKLATALYAVRTKKIHILFHRSFYRELRFADFVPVVSIGLGDVDGFVLRWDAPLMAELKLRGAVFPDYPEEIDRYLETAIRRPAEGLVSDFARFRRFYFDENPDPPREALFRELIDRLTALPGDTGR